MSPTRYDRPANLIVCAGVQAEVETVETDVEFYTRIETDSANTSMTDASRVSGEVIDSLAARICDTVTSNNLLRTRQLEGPCILSISTGTPDQRIVSCTPETNASKSCTWYRGSLRLFHLQACASNEISLQVLGTLRNITITDFSGAASMGSVKVTDVEFTDAPSLGKEITEKSVDSRKRLTSSGASVTVILTLTLVGLVALLFAIRRVRKYRLGKVSFDDSAIGNKNVKPRSHIEPNWRDIGARHSGMDCRHCNSVTCSECGNDANQVKMFKFDRNAATSISRLKNVVKAERKTISVNKRQRQAHGTLVHDAESQGIRIDENGDHCQNNVVGVVAQSENGNRSILL